MAVESNYEVGLRLMAHDQTGPGTQSAQDRLRAVARGKIPLKIEDQFSKPLDTLKTKLG